MIIELKYFGRIAEITGLDEESLECELSLSVKALEGKLIRRWSALEKESFKIAVNQQLVNTDFEIKTSCEVAVLPPFAGG